MEVAGPLRPGIVSGNSASGHHPKEAGFYLVCGVIVHLCSTFQNSVAFTGRLIRALPILSCGKGRSLSSSCGISGPVLCRRHEVTGSRSQAGD